ncbi:hypothetical protein BX666DRAFT_540317 [Dichotomocladium elegans]|nr:hypothetical protein BX666DRAFT_540317 [Dichotomocladium elegans]
MHIFEATSTDASATFIGQSSSGASGGDIYTTIIITDTVIPWTSPTPSFDITATGETAPLESKTTNTDGHIPPTDATATETTDHSTGAGASSLSTAGKIGVVVGSVVGGVLLMVMLAFFIWRRKRRAKSKRRALDVDSAFQQYHYDVDDQPGWQRIGPTSPPFFSPQSRTGPTMTTTLIHQPSYAHDGDGVMLNKPDEPTGTLKPDDVSPLSHYNHVHRSTASYPPRYRRSPTSPTVTTANSALGARAANQAVAGPGPRNKMERNSSSFDKPDEKEG